VASLNSDEVGFVKSSELLRSVRPWVLRASVSSPPVWQSVAQWAAERLRHVEKMWIRWTAPSSANVPLSTYHRNHAYKFKEQGTELSYSFNATVNKDNMPPKSPYQSRESAESSSSQRNDSAVRVRINLHHLSGGSDRPNPSDDMSPHMMSKEFAIVLRLRLRLDITGKSFLHLTSHHCGLNSCCCYR
jgi:hypothetical protein